MKKWYLAAAIVLCGIASIGIFTTIGNARYPYSTNSAPVSSPSDHIEPGQLHVYADKAVIDKSNLIWATIEDTHSMEPTLNKNSMTLEQKPADAASIKVGDIISYDDGERIIIHRVISIGTDDTGWYAVAKGDNNKEADPGKVRFGTIEGAVVGILY